MTVRNVQQIFIQLAAEVVVEDQVEVTLGYELSSTTSDKRNNNNNKKWARVDQEACECNLPEDL